MQRQSHNIIIIPLGFAARIFFSELMASSSLPHVGEGISLSHIINISLQASTVLLEWSLLIFAM